MSTWQKWVEAEAEKLGLRKTSGYRSPRREAALGGPSTSFHSRGSAETPGALDIGGSSTGLTALYNSIRQRFGANINELFLNVPGSWQALKNGVALKRNPEAGRPQHLHVAIPQGQSPGLVDRFLQSPLAGGGVESARASAPPDCERRACAPDLFGGKCVCWSDVWVYGVAIGLLLLGVLTLYLGKRE